MSKRKVYRSLWWFDFRDSFGQEWNVILTSPDLYPALKNYAGLCVYKDREIIISASLPKWLRDQTVVHEMMHVSLQALKLSPKLRAIKYNNKELEEVFVGEAQNGLTKIISQLGFRLPMPPYGYKSLKMHSEHIDRGAANAKQKAK